MFCTVCGTNNPPGSGFCAKCGANMQGGPPQQQGGMQMGAPPAYMQAPMMPPIVDQRGAGPRRTSGLAIAGFVLSFFGMLSIIGLILACVGLSEISKGQGQVGGKGLAIAAICITGFWILVFLGFASGAIRPSHMF